MHLQQHSYNPCHVESPADILVGTDSNVTITCSGSSYVEYKSTDYDLYRSAMESLKSLHTLKNAEGRVPGPTSPSPLLNSYNDDC